MACRSINVNMNLRVWINRARIQSICKIYAHKTYKYHKYHAVASQAYTYDIHARDNKGSGKKSQ